MNYMYCSTCGRITEGIIKTGFLGSSVTCGTCGESIKLSSLNTHLCQDCGVILYAPKALDVVPQCPCKEAVLIESAEPTYEIPAPAGMKQEQKQEQKHPSIKCPRCEAQLDSEDGTYGPCPMCREIPSRLYVSQQLYLLAKKHGPIEIKWDPKPNEMVYVHHHASSIPLNSLLIVNPNQQAAYISGGQMVVLDAGQTYALFNDELEIADVARSIGEGTMTMPPLALKLNTKVIFFDNKKHEVELCASSRIAASSWKISLPLSIDVQVCDPESLLRNALNLYDGDDVSDFLKKKAADAVVDALCDEIAFLPQESADEANSEHEVRLLMRNTLKEMQAKLLADVNRSLTTKYGIAIDSMTISYTRAEVTRV